MAQGMFGRLAGGVCGPAEQKVVAARCVFAAVLFPAVLRLPYLLISGSLLFLRFVAFQIPLSSGPGPYGVSDLFTGYQP